MQIAEFFKKVGYESTVLEDVSKCNSLEEKVLTVLEWVNDLDRGFELGEGEELDSKIKEYLNNR